METEHLGTEATKAGGPGSQQAGPQEPWDSKASFVCGRLCCRSTCLYSWGLRKEPGQRAVSLELRVETAGPDAALHPRGRRLRYIIRLKTALPSPLLFLGSITSSDGIINL